MTWGGTIANSSCQTLLVLAVVHFSQLLSLSWKLVVSLKTPVRFRKVGRTYENLAYILFTVKTSIEVN